MLHFSGLPSKFCSFFLRLLEIFETAFAASSRLIGSVVAALSLMTSKYLVALLILSASMVVMLVVSIVMFNCRIVDLVGFYGGHASC